MSNTHNAIMLTKADGTGEVYGDTQNSFVNINNAGSHNSTYRGKYLGTQVTAAQYDAIDAGTFDDLYIGDYWTLPITIDGTTTDVNFRIAAFDYWLNTGYGTVCSKHHVVLVPDTVLYNAQMNTTAVTTGAYYGSAMRSNGNTSNGYAGNLGKGRTAIKNAFGDDHVLAHIELLTDAVTNGASSGWGWFSSDVDLMNESMVYGRKGWCSGTGHDVAIDKTQFPLFAMEPSRLMLRIIWWLRDVSSATGFSNVGDTGAIGANNSNTTTAGVRPCFGICKSNS